LTSDIKKRPATNEPKQKKSEISLSVT